MVVSYPVGTKKDGGLRAVADLRKLNDCVIRDGFPMPDVNESLDQLAGSHSVPAEVLSDRGTNFMSKAVQEFLSKLGCPKTQTSAYKPSSNGSVEGFHGYMTKAVAAFVNSMTTGMNICTAYCSPIELLPWMD